ncbi:MAG TPA: diaminopimelate epimerase [Rhabdochlamydiaceae bacterium]|jgi:diaminopimelate epimerase
MKFSKYQGAGNDFILIDNRLGHFPANDARLVQRLCDRRTGVGADGILLLESSHIADYKMRILNADGSEPGFCGNGIRCLIAFLRAGEGRTEWNIEIGGRVSACRCQGEEICVNLGVPIMLHWPLSLDLPAGKKEAFVLHTGVPHAVIFVEDIADSSFIELAKQIRWHSAFAPEGVNVNCVKIAEKGSLLVRSFERGVEGETLACGSGAAAAAWVAHHLHGLKEPVEVHTRSCFDTVEYEKSMRFWFPGAQEIEMTGSAHLVFSGQAAIIR